MMRSDRHATPTKQLFDDFDLQALTPSTAARLPQRRSQKRERSIGDSPNASTTRLGKHHTTIPETQTPTSTVDTYCSEQRLPASPVPRAPLSIKRTVVLGGSVVAPQTALRRPQPVHRRDDVVASLLQGSSATPVPSVMPLTANEYSPPVLFRTPTATQLFLPDEPLTATQEAFVADGFQMPSPPPFFGQQGVDAHDEEEVVLSTQAKASEWATCMKAFFDLIDSRRLVDVDPTL